jgi:hypothetical protein
MKLKMEQILTVGINFGGGKEAALVKAEVGAVVV